MISLGPYYTLVISTSSINIRDILIVVRPLYIERSLLIIESLILPCVIIGSQYYPWKSSLSDKLHTNQLLNMHVTIGSCDESKVGLHHFTI